MKDLSTISDIIDALINIHCEEKRERATILFNCAYGLLLNAKEYASDFDHYYGNKLDKIPFAQSTDALAEVFETASARLSTIAQLKQE